MKVWRNSITINQRESLELSGNLYILTRTLLRVIFSFKYKQSNAFSLYKTKNETYFIHPIRQKCEVRNKTLVLLGSKIMWVKW